MSSRYSLSPRGTRTPGFGGLVRSFGRTAKAQATTLGVPLAVAWVSLAVNTVLGGALSVFGVQPRSIEGLRGILFAPFLHGNLAHLTANTVSFVVLGWLVLASAPKVFLRVTLCAALGSGLVSWLFGAPGSVHIGASGVIFGYLGYLMLAGVFARKLLPVLVSLTVTGLWGAMVWGVLPGQVGVSWQGHLGGFVGGVLAARWLHRRSTRR
jgi:membrane associated rhomboid family serine protease